MNHKLTGMLLCLLLTLAACASTRVPTQVESLVSQLKCEMTTTEVEALAGSALRFQGQRTWGTHTLKLGTTDIWLQFDDEQHLHSAQVATLVGLMKMKLWPCVFLCEPPYQ